MLCAWARFARNNFCAEQLDGPVEKTMNAISRTARRSLVVVALGAAVLVSWYPFSAQAEDVKVMLSGGQEVPPVTSSGSGSGTISIGDDKTVTGSVTTTGGTGTMAHIHNGATGKNGPVVMPLSKNGENTWAVPSGVKLTDAQYAAFKAGDLYVNVHSAQHQGGEVRGQLKP
jgi:CHRD domain